MARGERAFVVAMLVWVAAVLCIGVFHYAYELEVLAVPMAVGCVLLGLGTAQLLGRPRGRAPCQQTRAPGTHRRTVVAMVWVITILPLVTVLGYAAGSGLYVLACLRTHGKPWRLSLALCLAVTALVYGGFHSMLGVPLPVYPLGFR